MQEENCRQRVRSLWPPKE